jgi:hypothetical protein
VPAVEVLAAKAWRASDGVPPDALSFTSASL